MSETKDIIDIIKGIIDKYPEKEWVKQCKKSLPNEDNYSILASIEIACGGDCLEIPNKPLSLK
ncbi:MAG: hypothetical protein WCS87_01695 [Methylococcaceae bacterium]